jgi:hypothetical protein
MQSTQQITSIKEATMTSKFFSSNRINHDCGMYHEQIFCGDDLVAFVRSDPSDGTYWWAINGGSAISRGYKTVADCKAELFNQF